MPQSERERLLMIRDAVHRSGVLPGAVDDAHTRVEQYVEKHFAGRDVDAVDVRQYLDRELRPSAPHLWPSQTTPVTLPPPPPGAGPDKPRRPQPLALTPAQQAEAMKLPPLQRLTYYRERQEEAQQRR
jgi:hypothetical protein